MPERNEYLRGRSLGPKCRSSTTMPTAQTRSTQEDIAGSETRLKDEWFAGALDSEELDNTSNNTCTCGKSIVKEVGLPSDSPNIKLSAYPPSVIVSGIDAMLVKGSTCQSVMQLHEQKIPATSIARKVTQNPSIDCYSPLEVEALIKTCTSLGLNGSSSMATKSWENELIEGWWFKEESCCEGLRRQAPVSKEICGYDCDDGWWKKRQHEHHRDWDRWGDRSIGDPSQRSKI